jgi:hypothetical protein
MSYSVSGGVLSRVLHETIFRTHPNDQFAAVLLPSLAVTHTASVVGVTVPVLVPV